MIFGLNTKFRTPIIYNFGIWKKNAAANMHFTQQIQTLSKITQNLDFTKITKVFLMYPVFWLEMHVGNERVKNNKVGESLNRSKKKHQLFITVEISTGKAFRAFEIFFEKTS